MTNPSDYMSSDSTIESEPLRTFDADGVEIAYRDVGDGPPIVLVHGSASSHANNWGESGWIDALSDAGRRVIALDCRGHGESEKPHDPEAYGIATMAADVVRLLDHLDLERADVMGYSMGARITTQLIVDSPDRVNAAVLAGLDERVFEDRDDERRAVADALTADDPDEIDEPSARGFREFVESRGADPEALAAIRRAPASTATPAALRDVDLPVLAVSGGEDDSGDPDAVAEPLPNGETAVVPGEDHLSTVAHREFKDAVLDFLDREGL